MASCGTVLAEHRLGRAAGVGGVLLLVTGLVVAPTDAVQGPAQRLMYVHVPAAWVAYLCFAVVLWSSAAYLVRRDLRWDRRAQAAAEVGVPLTALTIGLGALWGEVVWGTWWTWDPRLVTTALLLLVYVGYLAVRGLWDERHTAARRSAVLGVLAFAQVPVVHFSVLWWRTLHQPPTVLGAEAARPPLDPLMGLALLVAVCAFTSAAGWVFLRRVRALEATAEQRSAGAAPTGSVRPVAVPS